MNVEAVRYYEMKCHILSRVVVLSDESREELASVVWLKCRVFVAEGAKYRTVLQHGAANTYDKVLLVRESDYFTWTNKLT